MLKFRANSVRYRLVVAGGEETRSRSLPLPFPLIVNLIPSLSHPNFISNWFYGVLSVLFSRRAAAFPPSTIIPLPHPVSRLQQNPTSISHRASVYRFRPFFFCKTSCKNIYFTCAKRTFRTIVIVGGVTIASTCFFVDGG